MRRGSGIKIGDVILMAVIAAAALVMFLFPFATRGEATAVEIENVRTGEITRHALGLDGTYSVTSDEVSLTVRVEAGEVSVVSADCRDRICVHTPAISRAGQSIVCAPAGIVVRIVGEEADVDGISG